MLGRGFGGHEHLTWFGLINMNARLYDPLLGRFVSPDPFVQMTERAANFNRYLYGLNNPLVNIDINGEFIWTIITFIGDFLSTLFNGGLNFGKPEIQKEAWKKFDPSAPWSLTNKAWKIDMGLFQSDPNRTIMGRIWQIASRFLWEPFQTTIGNFYSHLMNWSGSVDRVDYFGGATFVTNENSNSNKGITIGNYVNIDIRETINDNFEKYALSSELYMHEYAHTLQSKIWGPGYLLMIGVPSLVGAGLDVWGLHDHDREWYETNANIKAYKYISKFEPNSPLINYWHNTNYPREYDLDWYFPISISPIFILLVFL